MITTITTTTTTTNNNKEQSTKVDIEANAKNVTLKGRKAYTRQINTIDQIVDTTGIDTIDQICGE